MFNILPLGVLVYKSMFWIRMNLRKFQPSNGKCNIRMLFILPYKEVCWLKLILCNPGAL